MLMIAQRSFRRLCVLPVWYLLDIVFARGPYEAFDLVKGKKSMPGVEEYLDLPEDPELAFVEFEKNLRKDMQNRMDQMSQDFSSSSYTDIKTQYATKVMAFHDANSFNFLEDPRSKRRLSEYDTELDVFIDEVLYWTTQIEIRHSQRRRPISTILSLTSDIRQQLHSYITKIREMIHPMELSSQKKEAILTKLNALADEIDRDRTRAEALIALTLEVASTGGQAAKELEPAKKIIDSMTNLFGKAKEIADRFLGLPSPTSQKRIEGPRKQLPSPEESPAELDDDEIPF